MEARCHGGKPGGAPVIAPPSRPSHRSRGIRLRVRRRASPGTRWPSSGPGSAPYGRLASATALPSISATPSRARCSAGMLPALRPTARRLEASGGAPPRLCPMDATGVRVGRNRNHAPVCTSYTPSCRRGRFSMNDPLSKLLLYLITQNPCASTPSGTLNLLRKFSSATAAVSSTSCGSVK